MSGELPCDQSCDLSCDLAELERKAPEFVSKLKDVEVKMGEEARFDCKVTAQPEPELKW